MKPRFNLESFIKTEVVKRQTSLFADDLLSHQTKLSAFLNGSKILVIGGAGTIGSSYIKAILKFKPKRLLVVDKSENDLAELVRDLRSRIDVQIPEEFICYPFNYASDSFKVLLDREGPFDLVANFAAHKHVRSEKDELSIKAMLENNVLNLYDLLERLKNVPPKIFFSVSTDKAANPVNVMGASKKLMEKLMFSYTTHFKVRSARFANVAFSNGSLPYAFLRRIEQAQPLSSPNDVRRYFVSPEESGQLCLLASMIPEENSIAFPMLDPDKDMMRFSEIAEALLKWKGFDIKKCSSEREAKEKAAQRELDSAYPVYFFETNTSGEKMFEEFISENEKPNYSLFNSLAYINKENSMSNDELKIMIGDLRTCLTKKGPRDKATIIETMRKYLPDFNHIETGKQLDHKM